MGTTPPEPIDDDRDALTGLVGIDAVRERIAQWQGEAEELAVAPIHAMMLGLRRFDTVNLAYGAAAGAARSCPTAAGCPSGCSIRKSARSPPSPTSARFATSPKST